VNPETLPPGKRRHGQELEGALLDAAWEQLVQGGYGAFTFDAVAERARTSRPVLYRRWATREQLVVAAMQHFMTTGSRPVPDTGSLRGDVIALLTQANETRSAAAAVISVQLAGYYQENDTTPGELRRQLLGDRSSAMETVIRRAVDRGDIAGVEIAPRILAVPFDLFRNEALLTLKALPHDTIIEIVDCIFLPLIKLATQPEGQSGSLAP
jgi:AcrR family transcriptional regulator